MIPIFAVRARIICSSWSAVWEDETELTVELLIATDKLIQRDGLCGEEVAKPLRRRRLVDTTIFSLLDRGHSLNHV